MKWLAVLVACAVGCTPPFDSVTCADGRTCPASDVCDDVHGLCVAAEQLEACLGLQDGEPCSARGGLGLCRDSVCLPHACGDGVVSGSERCDGASGATTCEALGYYNSAPVSCTADCLYDMSACTGLCGDGVSNGPELCDGSDLGGIGCTDLGYYDAPGLSCGPLCAFDTTACTGYCGDAVVNGPEQCDGAGSTTCQARGFTNGGTIGCTAACGWDTSTCSN